MSRVIVISGVLLVVGCLLAKLFANQKRIVVLIKKVREKTRVDIEDLHPLAIEEPNVGMEPVGFKIPHLNEAQSDENT